MKAPICIALVFPFAACATSPAWNSAVAPSARSRTVALDVEASPREEVIADSSPRETPPLVGAVQADGYERWSFESPPLSLQFATDDTCRFLESLDLECTPTRSGLLTWTVASRRPDSPRVFTFFAGY